MSQPWLAGSLGIDNQAHDDLLYVAETAVRYATSKRFRRIHESVGSRAQPANGNNNLGEIKPIQSDRCANIPHAVPPFNLGIRNLEPRQVNCQTQRGFVLCNAACLAVQKVDAL